MVWTGGRPGVGVEGRGGKMGDKVVVEMAPAYARMLNM